MLRLPFLTELGPNDVLVGRGAPSNTNEGNRRYRDLVMSRKDEYIATCVRKRKNQIAQEIVNHIINKRKGHFVRKIESPAEAEEMGVPRGMTAWAFVPKEVAMQKTKQALRDQAIAFSRQTESRSIGAPKNQSSRIYGLSRSGVNEAGTEIYEADSQSFQRPELTSHFLLNQPHLSSMPVRSFPSTSLSQSGFTTPQPRIATSLIKSGDVFRNNTASARCMSDLIPNHLAFLGENQSTHSERLHSFDSLSIHSPRRNTPWTGTSSAVETTIATSRDTTKRAPPLPSLPLASFDGDDESAGETALRNALETALDNKGRHRQRQYVDLSQLDLHILTVVSAIGIPSRKQQNRSLDGTNQEFDNSFTWSRVGHDIFHVVLFRSGKSTLNVTSGSDPHGKNEKQESILISKEIQQAQALKENPRELSATVVLLLQRIRTCCLSSASDFQLTNYETWFGEEISRWAESLSQEMHVHRDRKQHESRMTIACMDHLDSRRILEQVSCITRLRDVVQREGSASLLIPKLVRAQESCDKLNKKWSSRPKWWVSEADSMGDDVLLIDMVLQEGVLYSRDIHSVLNPRTSNVKSTSDLTLKQLGISKASVQERMSQLVEELHNIVLCDEDAKPSRRIV